MDLHSPNEQLDTHDDLVMSAHLQVYHPYDWHAEDDDVGDEVGDARAQPSGPGADAVSDSGRPRGAHGRAGGEIVGDGTEQEATDGGEGGHLDEESVFAAGAGDEDAAVEDDEGEFEQAERGGPGHFFDEECLAVRRVWVRWSLWGD